MLLVEKFIVVRPGWLKIVLQVLANFSGNLIRARRVIQGLNSVKTVLFTFWTAIDLAVCVVLALNSSDLDCCVVSSHFKLFCVWFNISTLELQFLYQNASNKIMHGFVRNISTIKNIFLMSEKFSRKLYEKDHTGTTEEKIISSKK